MIFEIKSFEQTLETVKQTTDEIVNKRGFCDNPVAECLKSCMLKSGFTEEDSENAYLYTCNYYKGIRWYDDNFEYLVHALLLLYREQNAFR